MNRNRSRYARKRRIARMAFWNNWNWVWHKGWVNRAAYRLNREDWEYRWRP